MHPEINALNHLVTETDPESVSSQPDVDTPADVLWYEAESIRTFMPMQRQSQIITLFVIPMIFALLYESVYLPGLYTWTLI